MSTYNETESNIRESVESILSQTLSEFELIVVNDNPIRTEIKSIFDSYDDSRIHFYQNPLNIGLAMSMNKAAKMAKSNIFVRMDADDIAQPTRLEKQYQTIRDNTYDFIFSDYSYIDEQSVLIEDISEHQYYTSEELSKVLARVNVIHHPTVMFTRAIFEKVGGYRDFPCSQDADLWFRMQEVGCRFYMINEKLLLYRVNSNSVSNTRWYQQQLTCNYIYDLSIERLQNGGKDSFSIVSYNKYLQRWGLGDFNKEKKLRRDYELLSKANKYITQGYTISGLSIRIWVFLTSVYMRKHILQVKKKASLLKNKNNRK